MIYPGLISTEEWLKAISRFFESGIDNNKITINPTHGRGYFETHRIEEGFDINLTDIILNKDISVRRQKSDNKRIIIKYLIQTPGSYLAIKSKDDRLKVIDGIYVSTSHSFDTNHIKAGCRFQVLSILLSFDWIKKHHQNDSFILNEIIIEHPLFIFEKMTPNLLQLAKKVFTVCESDSTYKEFLFNATAMELLAHTFSVFDNRKEMPCKAVIKNQQDIDLLFSVRERLITSFADEPPTIQSLSKKFGISPTKLKTNFKVVFGKPIFQYYQQERMEFAKRLVESRNYTISEVGFKVGYTNLSKFSSAYKKQFGFNPKETKLIPEN